MSHTECHAVAAPAIVETIGDSASESAHDEAGEEEVPGAGRVDLVDTGRDGVHDAVAVGQQRTLGPHGHDHDLDAVLADALHLGTQLDDAHGCVRIGCAEQFQQLDFGQAVPRRPQERQAVGDDLLAGCSKLGPDQQRQQSADQEEEERGDHILGPDDLVVGVELEVVLPAKRAVVRMVLRDGRLSGRPAEPVVERAEAEQEVGCREVEEVQDVALHHLTVMHQPAHLFRRGADFIDAMDHVHGLRGRQMVAHRTDAAEALHDHGQLPVGPSLDEPLEPPELHYVEPGALDFAGRVFEDNFLIADVVMEAGFPTERWFWFEPSHGSGASTIRWRRCSHGLHRWGCARHVTSPTASRP